MATKYQVFISSTYNDLEKERDQIIKAALEMGHIPVGMEMFSAGDEQQWNLIKRQIDESDYYIVVLAHRYGSRDGDISYTEKEYDYAVDKGVPVLGFIIDDTTDWSAEHIDKDTDNLNRLNAFKDKVKTRIVSFWSSADDLYGKCSIALMKAITSYPRVGWVRASESVGPEIVNEVTRLSKENADLRAELAKSKKRLEATLETEEEKTIDVLSRNSRNVHVWLDGQKDWGEPIETTLLSIFEHMGKELINEASSVSLAQLIAFEFSNSNSYRKRHPVPSNFLREWLTDLSAVGLIQPSTKRHTVHDQNEYWMLTKQGKKVHANLRLLRLKRGLATKEKPDGES